MKLTSILPAMKLTSILPALCVATTLGLASMAQAQIQVVNSATSGNIQSPASATDDLYSIANYDNTGGEYIAVVVAAASQNSLSLPSAGSMTVTFDGAAMTNISLAGGDYGAGIWILKDPTDGVGEFVFDFNTNISGESGDVGWQVGLISLSGVNESAGANNDGIIIQDSMDQAGETFTAPELSAGDFFLMGNGALNSIGLPNYLTQTGESPSGSTVNFFGDNDPAGGGNRSYNAEYAILENGDMSGLLNNEAIFSSSGKTRNGVRPLIFLDAIPEPTSAAMMLGALGLLALRRRK